MKKILFLAISILIIFNSCNSGEPEGAIEPLPRGMYIAGRNYSKGTVRACYWKGSRRIDLDGYYADFIEAPNGKLLIGGAFLTSLSDENERAIAIINDKEYKVNPCHWVNGRRYDTAIEINKEINYDGKVYSFVKGDNSYFVNGVKVEIDADFSINSMTVSKDGRVYVVGYVNGTPSYFVDGDKFVLPEGTYISGCAIVDEKLWMVGSYTREDGEFQACYWADGERHDLTGSVAFAIFVE